MRNQLRRIGRLGRDFNLLWAGESISVLGSTLSEFALPLVAVQTLGATVAQMGVLAAVHWVPILFLGLFVGAWVDRVRRRPVMVLSNLLRAAVLAVVPIAAWFGALTLPLLMVVAALHGAFGVLFLVAYPSYLPSIVRKDQLAAGNARLEFSNSSANMVGPSLAGILSSVIGSAWVIALDVGSYLWSTLCLRAIRTVEPEPEQRQRAGVFTSIVAGLGFVYQQPMLRMMTIMGAVFNISSGIMLACMLLYVLRELGLSAAEFGLTQSIFGPGALIGSLLATRVAARLGRGRAIVGGATMIAAAQLALPFLRGSQMDVMIALATIAFVTGIGNMLWSINIISMRQEITPHDMLGRANAGMRTIILGVMPLGALLGGWLGETFGLRAALGVAATIVTCMVTLAWLGPHTRSASLVRDPNA